MKILLDQIIEAPKTIVFSEKVDELNLIYAEDSDRDFRFPPSVEVSLEYYRSGRELFFRGRLEGVIEGRCARCVEDYRFPIEKSFSFVLTPEPFSPKNKELNRDELGLSFYSAQEIDLYPFIREQVLLALPTRPLCKVGCRGLCGGCGANLNNEVCHCVSSPGDPRLTLFQTLKLGQ